MSTDMSKEGKYILSMFSALITKLEQKGVLNKEDYEEIRKMAKLGWIMNLTEKHEGFGI